MRWEKISFEKNIYTIDSSISKIKKTLQFSLTDTLRTVLKDYGIKSSGLVFASNQNENHQTFVSITVYPSLDFATYLGKIPKTTIL